MAREISDTRTSAILIEGEKTKLHGLNSRRKNRLSAAALAVLLSTVLSGCESSQLLDLGGPASTSPETTSSTTGNGQNGEAGGPVEGDVPANQTANQTAGGQNPAPHAPAARVSTGADGFPSLQEQPDKPRKTLSVAEKDREIREIQDSSQNLVRQRETNLDSRKKPSKPARKPASGGIFGLGWLVNGDERVSKPNKSGLTPPEKLRLSRIKAANRPDTLSTSPNPPSIDTGLRTAPILPSVPEKKLAVAKVDAARKTTSRSVVSPSAVNIANRPTAQKPIMVFFSKGARNLSKKQQKPLDKVAMYRKNDGMNVYVLGFSQVVPQGNNQANIESQDLAISRANSVANALRKRGFSAEQVVVQIIDEIQGKGKKTNATLRRVDVYFENSQLVEQSEISAPGRKTEKSAFGNLENQPFEFPDSGN